MFFKRRPPAPIAVHESAPPVPPAPPTLMDRAADVARSLRAFEKTAYGEGHTAPDENLVQAREAVASATKVIEDGRLAYALLRQLLSETRTWHAWSLRADFQGLKNFQCSNVVATERKEPAGYRTDTIRDTSFAFAGRPYRIVHLDKGYSPAPDLHHKWGDVSFFAGEVLVLSAAAIQETGDDFWTFEAVKALRVGDGVWMTDLLQIATDIEHSGIRSREKWIDDMDREAAKNIQL
jgi:hypothetical protein